MEIDEYPKFCVVIRADVVTLVLHAIFHTICPRPFNAPLQASVIIPYASSLFPHNCYRSPLRSLIETMPHTVDISDIVLVVTRAGVSLRIKQSRFGP
jgi:hypothetical protein